jgi:hypothetical protein
MEGNKPQPKSAPSKETKKEELNLPIAPPLEFASKINVI